MKTTRRCSIDGCDHKHESHGLCAMHNMRVKRRGTTDRFEQTPAAVRLADGLVRQPNGCLEWTGYSNDKGYGLISTDGKTVKTHRLAWVLANGPIPDGLHVLHRCDNPPCGETDPTEGFPEGHLFLGTQLDNIADMDAKGRRGARAKTEEAA